MIFLVEAETELKLADDVLPETAFPEIPQPQSLTIGVLVQDVGIVVTGEFIEDEQTSLSLRACSSAGDKARSVTSMLYFLASHLSAS
jgi:hypothetical protein